MCAISGILSPKGVNSLAIKRMNQIQKHRGPDGEGEWYSPDKTVGLGHRRLAIIDLTPQANQPLLTRGKNHTLVFNGEIYNFVELKKELQNLGHDFSTASDSEVLLRAYLQWGVHCLERFNGMFAFAIWDESKRQLFCARDRFGEKPFLFSFFKNGFAFASEAKALLSLTEINDSLDTQVLASNLIRDDNQGDGFEQTLFCNVFQLLPSQAMLVDHHGESPTIQRKWFYWQIDRNSRNPYGSSSLDQACQYFMELFKDAVSLRLRADVPVGSSLSGGLDSSSVVSMIRHLDPLREIRTFTGRFPNNPTDEGKYASLVHQINQTIHFEVQPTPERFINESPEFFWHAEFPVGGLSQFAQWCVFKLASENGIKVLLDGQGSDEILGGYGGHIELAYLRQLFREHRFIPWLKEHLAAAKTDPVRFSLPRILINDTFLSHLRPFLRRVTKRPSETILSICHPSLVEQSKNPIPFTGHETSEESDTLSDILWKLSFRTMLASLLRFGDRLSMAHALEVRLPFCDHRIAEFAFQLAPEFLVGGGDVKKILRKATSGLIPQAITERKKQGFLPPQNEWLTKSLLTWLLELNHFDKGPFNSLINRKKAEYFLMHHPESNPVLLWRLLNYRSWSHFYVHRIATEPKVSAHRDGEHIQLKAI
jgi:asparagine synthase (glutamine-hydrolysing)